MNVENKHHNQTRRLVIRNGGFRSGIPGCEDLKRRLPKPFAQKRMLEWYFVQRPSIAEDQSSFPGSKGQAEI
jgi:hypothetical protein